MHQCPSLVSEPIIFKVETALEELITCKSAGTEEKFFQNE
jgi:hypothetical protein